MENTANPGVSTEDISNGVVLEEEQNEPTSSRKCHGLRTFFHQLCMPCSTKYNPLPPEPSYYQRFKFTFMCPPHGIIAQYIQFLFLCGITFAVLVAVFKEQALPGGNFFSLYVLFFGSILGGYLISFIKLPPLLGKLSYRLKRMTTFFLILYNLVSFED